MIFRERLAAAQGRSRSSLVIGLAPALSRLPLPIQRYDEPLLPFGKAVVDATLDLACGYVFHLAAYLALGAAGAVALERTIAYVPGSAIKILHGPFASADYAPAAFENAFGVDAVTLVSAGGVRAYLEQPHHGVFVEAAEGFDRQSLLKLNEDYPGQIGTYRQTGPDQGMMEMSPVPAVPAVSAGRSGPSAPFPVMAWPWGSSLYTPDASQGDDFRNALRLAVTKLVTGLGQSPPNKSEPS